MNLTRTATDLSMPQKLRAPLLALACCALAALGGCASSTDGASQSGAASSSTSAPAATSSATTTAAAPPPEATSAAGMGYDELAASAKGPIARARQELVGQTVAVDLQRVLGRRGAPTGLYQVQAGDNLRFRCLKAPRGFSGGPVVSEVRAVRIATKSPVRTIDLVRCDSDASAPR